MEGHLLEVGGVADELAGFIADLGEEEAADAGVVVVGGEFGGVEETEGDGGAGVEKGGEAGEGHAVTADFDAVGEVAEVPAGEVVFVVARVGGGGEGVAGFDAEGFAEGVEVAALGDGFVGVVDNAEVHVEVGGEFGGVEGGGGEGSAGDFAEVVGEGVEKRLGAEFDFAGDALGGFGDGDEGDTEGFGEGADEGGDFFEEEAGDEPLEGFFGNLVEDGEGDDCGNAVEGAAGVEVVLEFEGELVEFEVIGVLVLGNCAGGGGEDVVGLHEEESGLVAAGGVVPGFEGFAGEDSLEDSGVVEGDAGLRGSEEFAGAAGFGFQGEGLLFEGFVVGEEGGVGAELALDEGVENEEVAGGFGEEWAVVDGAAGDEEEGIERDFFVGEDACRVFVPVGVGVEAFDEVVGGTLDPLRGDARDGAGVEAGGFDEFGGGDPGGFGGEECGGGVDVEFGAAESGVFDGVGFLADVGDQTGEEGAVDGVEFVGGEGFFGFEHEEGPWSVVRGPWGRGKLFLAGTGIGGMAAGFALFLEGGFAELVELAVDVLPFAEAGVGEEVLFAVFAELAAGEFAGVVEEPTPEVEVGDEVGVFVLEFFVGFVGLFLFVVRTFAGVLNGEGGGDDEDFFEAGFVVGGEDHAA